MTTELVSEDCFDVYEEYTKTVDYISEYDYRITYWAYMRVQND